MQVTYYYACAHEVNDKGELGDVLDRVAIRSDESWYDQRFKQTIALINKFEKRADVAIVVTQFPETK